MLTDLRETVQVRPMRGADIPALIDMGKRMHAESAYRSLPYTDKKVEAIGVDILSSPNKCCFVAHAGKPIGVIAGYVTEYWFGTGRIAQDYTWYVDPEWRGSSAAIRLLRAWVGWGESQGVDEICNGVSTEIDTEKTGRILEKMNFRRIGDIYKRRVV